MRGTSLAPEFGVTPARPLSGWGKTPEAARLRRARERQTRGRGQGETRGRTGGARAKEGGRPRFPSSLPYNRQVPPPLAPPTPSFSRSPFSLLSQWPPPRLRRSAAVSTRGIRRAISPSQPSPARSPQPIDAAIATMARPLLLPARRVQWLTARSLTSSLGPVGAGYVGTSSSRSRVSCMQPRLSRPHRGRVPSLLFTRLGCSPCPRSPLPLPACLPQADPPAPSSRSSAPTCASRRC